MSNKLTRLVSILRPTVYIEGITALDDRINTSLWKNLLLRKVCSVYEFPGIRLRSFYLRMKVKDDLLGIFKYPGRVMVDDFNVVVIHPVSDFGDVDIIDEYLPNVSQSERVPKITLFRPRYTNNINYSPTAKGMGYIPSVSAGFYIMALQLAAGKLLQKQSFTVMKNRTANIISYMK